MTIQIIPANRENYGKMRGTSSLKYIVVHYTGNDGDKAVSNGNYFKNNVVKTSAHYFVDDNNIVQSVSDNYIAWAVGGSKYSDTAQTGGGLYYGKCNNSNSISVELCDTVKDGVSAFTDTTINNAVELIRLLMKKYNIGVDNVIRHFDVVGKICPKPFIDGIAWQNFKNKIIGDELDMATAAELEKRIEALENKMIYNYIDQNMSDWARPTIQKLVGKGALKGNEKGELGLTEDLLRTLVILDRLGLFG